MNKRISFEIRSSLGGPGYVEHAHMHYAGVLNDYVFPNTTPIIPSQSLQSVGSLWVPQSEKPSYHIQRLSVSRVPEVCVKMSVADVPKLASRACLL